MKQLPFGAIGDRYMSTSTNNLPILLTDKYYAKLSSSFNILDLIQFKDYDAKSFKLLKERLSQLNREHFNYNDRIIIEHFEVDYYDEKMFKFGLNLYNLFSIINELNIPHFVLIICTNNFGLSKEIESIPYAFGKDHFLEDKPLVIETFITRSHYRPEVVVDIPVNTESICKPALSMMGAPREHRYALYNFIKKNELLGNIEISIRA